MRLLGREKLQPHLRDDETVRNWLCAWVSELCTANWRHPSDVSSQFPKVRQADSGQFVFPINDCGKKIYVQISFQQGVAIITGLQ
ncbi:type II toxin-antitoxin system HigB family toxin [Pseudohongiella sp.]|uniref:type II toxin-antitoxin system HigB family toxin n=1 Tax=Pseudohongiella sp. TaxID=1979412 RepID=UPI0034A07689